MFEKAIEVLRSHGLSITKSRIQILHSFLHSNESLDVKYFLDTFPEQFDRITVYRTLQLFAKEKLIYRVSSIDRFGRYLLQIVECKPAIVNHSSFICVQCRKVIPVNTIMAPVIEIPKGFHTEKLEVVVSGLCKTCIK